MTLSERQRQKKLEQKKKKRQLVKKTGSMGFGARISAASYAQIPYLRMARPERVI